MLPFSGACGLKSCLAKKQNLMRCSSSMWWKWVCCSSIDKWFKKKYTQAVLWQLYWLTRSCKVFGKREYGPLQLWSQIVLGNALYLPKRSKEFPVGIYLLKLNNRNTRTRCEICSELTVKTPEHIIADWVSYNLLVATSWFDNKRVLLVSNFNGKELLGECVKFDHTLKRKIPTTNICETI